MLRLYWPIALGRRPGHISLEGPTAHRAVEGLGLRPDSSSQWYFVAIKMITPHASELTIKSKRIVDIIFDGIHLSITYVDQFALRFLLLIQKLEGLKSMHVFKATLQDLIP